MENRRAEYLDEQAWIEAALDLLVSGPVDSVGIEPLAKKLGVTKGSFYWHFRDRAALLSGMLRQWQQRATTAIIARLESTVASPVERLRLLGELPHSSVRSHRGALVELAIRDWARKDPVAEKAVLEVDEQRLRYLTTLYKNIGFPEQEAKIRAYQMYSYELAEALITTGEAEEEQRKLRDSCVEFMSRPSRRKPRKTA